MFNYPIFQLGRMLRHIEHFHISLLKLSLYHAFGNSIKYCYLLEGYLFAIECKPLISRVNSPKLKKVMGGVEAEFFIGKSEIVDSEALSEYCVLFLSHNFLKGV